MTITSRKPKIPKPRSDRLKSSPSLPGTLLSTSGIRRLLMNDSTIAPSTTPQIDPRPPRMIIASTKIENENANWSALTVLR
jgi:hypothetical protein